MTTALCSGTNTIVRYLAAKHGVGSLLPMEQRERADADRWMDWASIHANPAMTSAFMGLIRTPADKRNVPQIEVSAEATAQQFGILEQGLEGRDYVAGTRFSMGDIAVGVNVYRWSMLEVKRPHLPRVESYHERLKQRPAFQRHIMKPLS
jgi:glutathione S-transferase